VNRKNILVALCVLVCVVVVGSSPAAAASAPPSGATAVRLVSGLQGGSGSTVGPDGALYVTERVAGRVSRVDPRTGTVTTFATGLPAEVLGGEDAWGGPVDVTFIGQTAYALVTLVGPDVGGNSVVGIYRVDGPNRFTVVADIGSFAVQHPPTFSVEVPTGVQYAIQTFRGRFLVTDGHHNRVYGVTLGGQVSELIAFADVVPTGLEASGNTIYVAEAGPVPHRPQDGKVVAFAPGDSTATEVASGAPLLVDVESGRGRTLFALSQGAFSGRPEGFPALPNTGALVMVNGNGGVTVIADDLDRPTSLEIIGNTAYVVTLTGEIWKIEGISGPPYGA